MDVAAMEPQELAVARGPMPVTAAAEAMVATPRGAGSSMRLAQFQSLAASWTRTLLGPVPAAMAPTEGTVVMEVPEVVEAQAETAAAADKPEDSSSFPAEMATAETAAMVAAAPGEPTGTTEAKEAMAARVETVA